MHVTSVFGPWEDLIVFIMPLILAFIAPDMFSPKARGLIHIILFKTIIQSGHLFITYFPIAEKKMHHERNLQIYVLLYFATFVVLNFISPHLFMNAFAITSMFHVINQHIGWYKKSQPHAHFWGKKWLLQILFYSVTALWLCNLFPATPGYIYNVNITGFIRQYFEVPELGRLALANLCFITVTYLVFAQKKIIDRPLFFIGTFGWLFSGMLFAPGQNRSFFILYALFSHGIGYTLYMWKKWPKRTSEGKYEWVNIKKVLAVAAIIGYLDGIIINYDHFDEQLLAFAWIPSILHYALDSKIWRSKKAAAKKEGSLSLPSQLETIEINP